MAIKRITISVHAEIANRIKKAAGKIPVSTWVTDVIEEHLDDAELEKQWSAFVADVAPTREDMRKAKQTHERLTKKTLRKKSAA